VREKGGWAARQRDSASEVAMDMSLNTNAGGLKHAGGKIKGNNFIQVHIAPLDAKGAV